MFKKIFDSIWKIIRYIVFIPIVILMLELIYRILGAVIFWFATLDIFWLIVVMVFGGISMALGMVNFLAIISSMLVSKVSPNKKFGFYVILILSIIYGLFRIYGIWTIPIEYEGKMIFISIVFTSIIIYLTYFLSIGGFIENED